MLVELRLKTFRVGCLHANAFMLFPTSPFLSLFSISVKINSPEFNSACIKYSVTAGKVFKDQV